MKRALLLLAVLLAVPRGVQGQASDKPNFSGTWSLDKAKSQLVSTKVDSLTWTIEQKGNSMHFIEAIGDNKAEIDCSTMGKECAGDAHGSPRKLSMFYNGPSLTQFETVGAKGDQIVRRVWKLSDDKKTLEIDVMHVVPEEKPEKLVFVKQ